MRRNIFLIVFAIAMAACNASAAKQAGTQAGGFALFDGRTAADIVVDPSDYKVVKIAANALAGDVALVAGRKPVVGAKPRKGARRIVIIGTIEKNGLIKKLARENRLDVSGIEGKWETFRIAVVRKPFSGVAAALVVAGSDRRAAAFGAFEISAMMGVSPWVWWADVKPERRKRITIAAGADVFGPPSVKYRGIFINDEDFGLKPWSAKTFEPELGDIGPKTYERVFELLLRLKANHLWPAMHNCTRAFNHYDRNKFAADDYAIVMGSSHCEQMLRNNVDEWDSKIYGEWTYLNNRENLLRYWDERVAANGKFENIYTLGMRAIHDNAMPDGKTAREKVSIVEDVIRDQRAILAKRVDPDVARVPQVFVPYKEVLEQYNAGLKVPEDVTLLWPDDNFGYIRRLPAAEERKRSGGSGIYYHISYWGPPHDYLWLNTTPPSLIWEEMRKAWAFDARKIWVVNVGDIKPHEIGMELFLQMGWDINRWNSGNIDGFLEQWAAREFGAEYAEETSEIMRQYYLLNYPRKPEHMGFYDKYSIAAVNQDPAFSLYNYGDEAGRRIAAFGEIEKRAEKLSAKLPAGKKDAFYQLVLYPVKASSQMNKKHLYGLKSRKYARQGRASADVYAAKSQAARDEIERATEYFNEKMAGGKWRGMMSANPNNLAVFGNVETKKAALKDEPSIGVAIEGGAGALETCAEDKLACSLPGFNRFTDRSYFIDIFNKSAAPAEWKAMPGADWIKLSKLSGKLGAEERIYVSVDYGRAPESENAQGAIEITGAGETFVVYVSAFNPAGVDAGGAFVQDGGVISIDAGEFSSKTDAGGAGWVSIPGLGRSGGAIIIEPPTAEPVADMKDAAQKAPLAEYRIFVFEPGEATVHAQAIPTHEIFAGRELRVGISVDGGEVLPVVFKQAGDETDDTGKMNVFRNMMEGKIKMRFERGPHTLKLWGADAGVAPDRIIINFGGLRKSYDGPPASKPERGK